MTLQLLFFKKYNWKSGSWFLITSNFRDISAITF